MRLIGSVCVYCGSSAGHNPSFDAAARAFGRSLAENGVRLVYGGGGLGLMGALAQSVLDHGGQVTGIIPSFLTEREHALAEVQEHIVTRNMHERKQMMFDHADGFVALPGGVGTLEELVEQLTWVQLGRHAKPVVIANFEGYWDPLLGMLAHMRREGFIKKMAPVTYGIAETVEEILPMMEEAAADALRKGLVPKPTTEAEPLPKLM
jgi:uncharacterized protein (TIGR00730 family)